MSSTLLVSCTNTVPALLALVFFGSTVSTCLHRSLPGIRPSLWCLRPLPGTICPHVFPWLALSTHSGLRQNITSSKRPSGLPIQRRVSSTLSQATARHPVLLPTQCLRLAEVILLIHSFIVCSTSPTPTECRLPQNRDSACIVHQKHLQLSRDSSKYLMPD